MQRSLKTRFFAVANEDSISNKRAAMLLAHPKEQKEKANQIAKNSRIIVYEYLFKNGYFKTAQKFTKQYQIQSNKNVKEVPCLENVILKYYKSQKVEKRKTQFQKILALRFYIWMCSCALDEIKIRT